jgi:hypothetical protein
VFVGITSPVHVSFDGALLEPPGVVEALRHMRASGMDAPNGVKVSDDGQWCAQLCDYYERLALDLIARSEARPTAVPR